MKIKRFFAPDMRQAIRKIREDQGPDAVILSNRKVEGGIEIVAAVDYDETIFQQMERKNNLDEPVQQPDQQLSSAGKPAEVKQKSPAIEWSQDPAIVEMRNEISSLKAILENRLTHLAWGEMARSRPERADVMHKLADMGIDINLSQTIASHLPETEDKTYAWRMALSELSRQIGVTDDDILTHGGIVALVGPTGVGKTTTVAKLAARFALRHGQNQVALVSTDSYRIGAHDQLQTFGRILGVPAYVATNKDELHKIIDSLQDKRLILIDTAGMSQRDMRLSEQLSTLKEGVHQLHSYLVLSANTQNSTLNEVAKAFQSIELSACILTKLDEATSIGGALSTIINYQLPLAYVSDGQRVPEDIQPARAHSLVSRAVTCMQQIEATEIDPSTIKMNGMTAHANV